MKKPSLTEIIVSIGIVLLVGYLFLPAHTHSRPSPVTRAQMEISLMRVALTNYQAAYGQYPEGGRAAILKRLLGENPQRIQFLTVNHASVNERGEYVDPWKTPYEVNFSTNGFVITSAGKDRAFKTADDIIFDSASNKFVNPTRTSNDLHSAQHRAL